MVTAGGTRPRRGDPERVGVALATLGEGQAGVITHLEELKEAFPTRIEVEKTAEGSEITIV